MWMALSLLLVYLTAHLAMYRVLRSRGKIGREREVFFYHLRSFVAVAAVALLAVAFSWSDEPLETFLAVIGTHAVYSMTFLEFWSVTEGSFFLSVLDRIRSAQGYPVNLEPLWEVGKAKREKRLAACADGGLVAISGVEVRLTSKGRNARRLFTSLRWIMGVKEAG